MLPAVGRRVAEPTAERVAEGTDAFYRENAQSYFDRTAGLTMAHLYGPFLEAVGDGRRLLDVGCGSGRDVKAFRAMGYDAFGIDASRELVGMAIAHVGPYFTVARAETYRVQEPFDAVWACASLLHLRRSDLHSAARNLRALLARGGVLFASVQVGVGERVLPDGRHFTYYGGREFEEAITEGGFQVFRSWESKDVMRSDGPTWINVLGRR